MADLHLLSAAELAGRLRRRELSALDVVAALLARIGEREPLIHAWVVVDGARALDRARALDAGPVTGPLHGLPIAVKDIFDTADFATGHGSPIYRGHRPVRDADCVAAAERAGAIVLGKSVTTEFATFAPAATVNPRNPAHTPGGSSSGSAAAVADGMVPLAFGTQTFGSVIRPASYCGIVGYKPSFGTIPRAGVKLLADSLDTVGVFARSVRDAALFAGAVSGRGALAEPAPPSALPRIGICRTHEWPAADDDARAALATAARVLGAAGADVVDVTLPPSFADLGAVNEAIYGYELARRLEQERRAHAEQLGDRLRESIDAGGRVTAERYAEAQRLADAARAALPDAMAGCDVLLTPSTTGEAPAGLESTGSPVMNRLWTLLHVPAVNVPGCEGRRGLPVGVQVVGRFGDDARTLTAADWIHGRLVKAGSAG